MKERVSIALLWVACAWAPSAAIAQQPRIVVLDYAGKGGAKARIQTIRALRDRATFETQAAAQNVLAKKGLSAKTAAGRAAVAQELSVDYVVWGSVRGKGSAARAKIRFSGPKGNEIASREAGPPGTSKGNARIQKASLALLAKALAVAPPASAEKPRKQEKAPPPPPPPPAAAAAAAPPPPPAAEVDEPVAVKIEVRTSREKYAPYVLILGGAGGRARKLEVNVDDGATGTGKRTYESNIYLDIDFRLEVRPLARNAIRGLRGLALEADGAFGVGLDAQSPTSNERLDTTAWRVLGQLGYFHRFRLGELGGLVGIGFDRLKLETNVAIPSVDYLYLRLGPAYRHFFIERLLYLRVDGGFRYPFSYGDLSDTFGPTSGFGFDAALMVGGELDVGFAYVARFSVDYFKPQFSGFPSGAPPATPPGAVQGRDATDLAFNFHVMVGWAF